MSDPLSILASVVALLDTGTKSAKHLRRLIYHFRHADDELIALSNEVNDLNVVLTEVESVSYNITILPGTQLVDALATQLDQANVKMAELRTLIDSLRRPLASGRMKANKIAWLNKKTVARRLQEDIRVVRQYIHGLLGIATAAGSARIEVNLETLQTSSIQHQTDLRLQIGEASANQENQRASLEQLIRESFLHIQDDISAYRRETNLRLDQVSAQGLANHASLNRITSGLTSIESGVNAIDQGLQSQISYQSTQVMHFSIQRRLKCQTRCACSCHIRRKYRSPSFFNRFLGRLYIGYSGKPLSKSQCDEESCQKQSTTSFDVVYFFPLWFIAKAVWLTAGLSPTGNPTLGVTTRGVLENHMAEFQLINMGGIGDTQGIKAMIESGRVSPNAVAHRGGYTVLHRAVSFLRIDTITFLLSAGADMLIEDDTGRSPLQRAWRQMLAKNGPPNELKELEKLFPLNGAEETFEFSHLHMVVLKLLPLDLPVMLQKPLYKSQVNFRDSEARTPLHWAVERNDVEAVKTLINHGAETNTKDLLGRTSLHVCLFRCSVIQPSITRILLLVGADVHAKDMSGDQALHIACLNTVSLELIEALIANGASVREKSAWGLTPFDCLVLPDEGERYREQSGCSLGDARCELGLFLIQKGAVLDNRDNDGDTALFQALYSCAHNYQFVEMLLSKGADYKAVNKSGHTILHFVAKFGDIEYTKILKRAELRGINPEAMDRKGKTARQLLEERIAAPEGLFEAFDDLLESIRQLDANQKIEEVAIEEKEEDEGKGEEEAEVEEFWEALEAHDS